MIHYLTPEAAAGFIDKDGDGRIDLRVANRTRFGGAATIWPLGPVPEGERKGLMAFGTVAGEKLPPEDTTPPAPPPVVVTPEPEPEPEPQPEPSKKRTLLGCNIGAGGMGSGTTIGTGYVYPTTAELQLAKDYGMECLRIPYKFQRIFDVNTGAMDPNVPKLIAVLDKAKELGFTKVVLSEHSFGMSPYKNELGKFVPLTVDHVQPIVDAFTKAFGKYMGQDWFVPAFVNEPAHCPGWYTVALAFQKAMRTVGWTNPLVISRDSWAGLHSLAESNADQLAEIAKADPAGKTILDLHQYVDDDRSGTKGGEVMRMAFEAGKPVRNAATYEEARRWIDRNLTPRVERLRSRGLTMLLGEFGIPNNASGAVATEAMLDWLDENSDVIVMATWWVLTSWMLYDPNKSFYGLSTINKTAPSPHLKRIAELRKA